MNNIQNYKINTIYTRSYANKTEKIKLPSYLFSYIISV
jgi:hypothetical protein